VTDHTIANEDMIDHVVKLVEAKAAELEAHKAAAEAVAAE
jgi:(E)-4-hydroxy-3-methylbut-2-enyl-diphosphate synthase